LETDALLLAGVIAPADGPEYPFAAFASPDAAGTFRWIVRADGRLTGAAKGDAGTGFIDNVGTEDAAGVIEQDIGL
jgi:hypothetical protein